MKKRDNRTFSSGVFASPDAIADQSNSTRLVGGKTSGTSGLFGDEKPDYQRSNHNNMIEAPKKVSQPQQNAASAAEAKAREIYGDAAATYGYTKNKRDGALMSSGADWKNTQSTGLNKNSIAGMNQDQGMHSREKKY